MDVRGRAGKSYRRGRAGDGIHPGGGPGEVLLPVRGGTEAFAAWSDEPIARHTRIVVVEALSGRSVFVTPFQQ